MQDSPRTTTEVLRASRTSEGCRRLSAHRYWRFPKMVDILSLCSLDSVTKPLLCDCFFVRCSCSVLDAKNGQSTRRIHGFAGAEKPIVSVATKELKCSPLIGTFKFIDIRYSITRNSWPRTPMCTSEIWRSSPTIQDREVPANRGSRRCRRNDSRTSSWLRWIISRCVYCANDRCLSLDSDSSKFKQSLFIVCCVRCRCLCMHYRRCVLLYLKFSLSSDGTEARCDKRKGND